MIPSLIACFALLSDQGPTLESYRAHMFAADAAFLEGDTNRTDEWLQGAPEAFRGWEWQYLLGRCDESIHTFRASEEAITKLAVHPQGESFASTGNDGTIRLWDAATLRLIREMKGHAAAVFGLSFSSDGAKLVSTSRDNSIRIWDVATGQSEVLGEHPVTPYNAAFSPDGTKVVSVGWRLHPVKKHPVGLIRVWDPVTKRLLSDKDFTTHPISSLAFSQDGKRCFIGCWEYQVVEMSMDTFSLGREFAPSDPSGYAAVDGVTLSSGETHLLSATKDKSVKVFDLDSGKQVATLPHNGHVGTVVVRGDRCITASQDQSIRVFDLTNNREIVRLQGHGRTVSALAVTPDGSWAFSGDGVGRIKVWDLRDTEAYRPKVQFDGAWSCVFSPDGTRIAVGTNAKTVQIIDRITRQVVQTLGPYDALVVDCAWSPDGTKIGAGSNDGSFRVWEVATGKAVWSHRGSGQMRSAAWSADGRYLASGQNGVGVVWDAVTGEVLYTAKLTGTISAAFSDREVFFGGGTRILQVSLPEGTLQQEYTSGSEIIDLAVNLRANLLVSGGTSGLVEGYSLTEGAKLWARKMNGAQWGVDISPDGSRVVSTGFDYAVHFMHPIAGREVWSIRNLPVQGFDVRFSPDGRSLAYMGGDGPVWWISLPKTVEVSK